MRRYLSLCDDCPDWREIHPTAADAARAGEIHAGRIHGASLRDDDIDAFVRSHARLASWFAAKAGVRDGETAGEVHADAMIGLWDAARRWDPNAGSFPAFAGGRIKGQISDGRRERDPRSRRLVADGTARPASLDTPLGDGNLTLADTVTNTIDPIGDWIDEQDARDLHRRLMVAVDQLPPRLAHVVRGHLNGQTLASLGAELSVTEARACQMRREAVDKMRAALCG